MERTFPVIFILSRKSPESGMYDHFALKAVNENQKTLMLSLLQFHSWKLRVLQVHDKANFRYKI